MERQELAQYIEAARKGDGSAITQLVKEYHSLIKRKIKEQLGENCDYKPIEIQALSNAFAHMDTLRDVDEFESWLLSYVRQEVLRTPLASTINLLEKEPNLIDSGEIPFGMDAASAKPAVSFVQPKPAAPIEAEEEEEEEEKEIVRPPLRPKKSAVREADMEEEEDDDDDEAFNVPGWLLGSVIAILVVVALGLILYLLTPKVYDRTFGLIPFLPKAEATPTVSPTPSPTALPTPTISAAATETPVETATPTPEASATPAAQTSLTKIGTVTVKVNGLNIRSSASTAADKVDSAVNGRSYDVFSTTTAGGYTWYQIGEGRWIADNGSWVTYTAD